MFHYIPRLNPLPKTKQMNKLFQRKKPANEQTPLKQITAPSFNSDENPIRSLRGSAPYYPCVCTLTDQEERNFGDQMEVKMIGISKTN
ncbi:hypothetical protein ERO13_D10G090050v2, partial [Gossypium hirsutum]